MFHLVFRLGMKLHTSLPHPFLNFRRIAVQLAGACPFLNSNTHFHGLFVVSRLNATNDLTSGMHHGHVAGSWSHLVSGQFARCMGLIAIP
jgi:hypothetical protein